MKNSKRTQRISANLNNIIDALNFYTNGSKEFDADIKEIQEFIEEMGLETKERDTRLARKLKKHWDLTERESSDDK